MSKIVKFKNFTCKVNYGYYVDSGCLAITLVDAKDDSPVATSTVNLENIRPHDNCVFIKSYSENSGMARALIQAGIIEPMSNRRITTGFVDIEEYRLTIDAIEDIKSKRYS